MTGTTRREFRRITAALALTAAGALVLAGCAPEPDGKGGGPSGAAADSTSEASGSTQGGSAHAQADGSARGNGEGSWGEAGEPSDAGKVTTLPESFPKDRFALPVGAQISDAGERSPTQWFVVLSAPDRAAADAEWERVIADNGFTVDETDASGDGGVTAHLTGPTLSVDALLIPDADGSVLLSYDIAATGG